VDAEIAAEFRVNRYDAGTGRLEFTQAQEAGWRTIVERYRATVGSGDTVRALPAG
jgi:hypothetical protein